MKKSLIALAVLAASGAAMAQSSVTLYGVADVWVGSIKSDTAGGASTRTTSMVSGGVSTSVWGLKGSEDLGGGLKANFQFEQGVNLDTGVAASGFDRQAWVGLSGGFGAIKFGKTGTAYDNVQGMSDAVFDSDLAPANTAGAGVFRTTDTGKKASNNIHYQSPTFGGFSGAVSYSLDEKVAAVVADPATVTAAIPAGISYTSFNLIYADGPLAAQLAYQKDDKVGDPDAQASTRLGASYNFGVATAKFMYGKLDNVGYVADAKTTEWQVGVDVPLSAALTLSGSYAKSTDDATATTVEEERSGYGLALAYSLSKRTTVYGGFKMVTDDNGAAADVDTDVFAVGVKHTF
ncbi:MAG: hypothetical protein BWK72_14590 [Rhodoferax ferrireducens]|uniref:Porin domain-containing protein n=1 Tax=Rhodoferax ferrireducens TaxID=192843 RepID=A0A1W9KSB8_9BURK|nr:MAG: hypothetical protein BWK72_14590 [Rhodoferax ferrireducens]